MGDVRDLLQKELRLASDELKTKVSGRLQASVWMAAAGLLGFVAVLFVLEGLVSSSQPTVSRSTGPVSSLPSQSQHWPAFCFSMGDLLPTRI
jgi:hypothetical protein